MAAVFKQCQVIFTINQFLKNLTNFKQHQTQKVFEFCKLAIIQFYWKNSKNERTNGRATQILVSLTLFLPNHESKNSFHFKILKENRIEKYTSNLNYPSGMSDDVYLIIISHNDFDYLTAKEIVYQL